ncbi:hypothetical protein SGPA1_20392 [Streptomyces misionensis JCM 4497]
MRAAPDHPRRLRHQAAARLHRGHRQGRRRARPDQHPVRDGRRHPLRPGGQPARLAHGPLHLEGDRGAARQGRRPDLAGRDHRRAARRGAAAEARRRRRAAAGRADLRQGGRDAVVALPRHPGPRRGHRPRPGDALHRRGHGHRLRLRHGVRQVAGGRLRPAAHQGPRVHLGRQPRQALDDLPGPGAGRPRLRAAGDLRHRRGPQAQRHQRHRGAQAVRGHRAERREDHRPAHPRRRGRPHRQHPVRHRRPSRRLRHPHGRRRPLRAVPDDRPGARRGRPGHRRPQPRRRGRPLAPGARGTPDRGPRLAAPRGTPETVSPSS